MAKGFLNRWRASRVFPALAALILLSPWLPGHGGEALTSGEKNALARGTQSPLEESYLPFDSGPNAIRTLGPPPGFEDAATPQTTLVDVYYGGRFLLSTLAEFTRETIHFRQPREITQLVPDLRSPEQFTTMLSQVLATHAELVCLREEQPLCGRLDPDDVGVIFDDRSFRVDLFIHRDQLKAPDPTRRNYLPPPDHRHLTLVQNLQSLYTNSSLGEERYSLFGRSRLARGHQFGFANWVSTQENDLSVDEIGYRRDFSDHQFTLGLFETETGMLRALPRQPLLGVSVGRSLNMRTDLDAAIASPIEVFLPSRSRVDILRDGRLISSAFYDVGIQLIDTGRLPPGSYLVDIAVTDASGNTRIEQQLFVKSSLLAPPGEPLWFVELGDVRARAGQEDSFPHHQDTPLLRTGYRWRPDRFQQWGLGLAGASTGKDHLGELSVNALFAGLQAGGEIFATDENGWGYSLRAASRWRDNHLSVNMQRIRADDVPGEPEDFRLLPFEQRLYNARFSRPFRGGQLGVNLSYSEQVDGTRQRRKNLQYTRHIELQSRNSLQWRVEIGDENGDLRGQLTLQWLGSRGHWRDSARLAYSDSEAGDPRDGFSGSVASRWHDRHSALGDLAVGGRLEAESNDRFTAGIDGDQRSAYGRLRAGVTATDERGPGRTGVSYTSLLGYDTSLLIGEEGGPVMGGALPAEGGVIVDLRDAPQGQFDLTVNGSAYTHASGGKRVALTLPPYAEYRLGLADRGSRLVSFDATPYQFPLYPGQVVTRSWALTTVNVLVGRVFVRTSVCDDKGANCRRDWQALGNTRIEGVEGYAITDELGYLQAEVASQTRALRAVVDGQTCTIDLSAVTAEQNVMRAPRLHCIQPEH